MIRTRFAPSPTGDLHIGGARTALFSYLTARHAQGEFILRVEDTDQQRSTESSVQAILDGMKWLDLNYDEGPFFQTQRFERYREVAQELIKNNQAYYCNCSKERLDQVREAQMEAHEKPRYDHHCRELNLEKDLDPDSNQVIRFKNPLEGQVSWKDLVKGEIKFSNQELDDMVIWRSDDSPTYNFTVVVDDVDMGITHVVRGDDHVNNTPRQINIFKALDKPCPVFAHLSMILGEDGKKMSKRHGATSVMEYRNLGYLPEALLNYLVRLGWSHGDQEIFSREELVKLFNLKAVNHSAAAFNTQKLNWVNQHYLKQAGLNLKNFEQIKPELIYHFNKAGISESDLNQGPDLQEVLKILSERVHTLCEFISFSKYFYQDFEVKDLDPVAVNKFLKPDSTPVLKLALEKLKNLSDLSGVSGWTLESIQKMIQDIAQELNIGLGKIGMPLRVVLTGGSQSPAIEDTIRLIGQERVIKRLNNYLK